ncbi:hypothetical protein [Clostridium lundense]|uniref:hypothetical protein n=1 Tax=Clostridium lundense TaxID=319475 RepID=UPI00048671D8|nr:hypothetical protein [Clostridium lundense]
MSKKHKHKNKCYCDCNNSNLQANHNYFILLGLAMLLCESLECIYDTREPEGASLDISIEDKCKKNNKKENEINNLNKCISKEPIINEDTSKEYIKNDSNIDILEDIPDSRINNDNNIDVAKDILTSDINNDNNIDAVEDISTSDIGNDNNINVVEDISTSNISNDNNIDVVNDIPTMDIGNDNNIDVLEDIPTSDINNDNDTGGLEDISFSSINYNNNIDIAVDIPPNSMNDNLKEKEEFYEEVIQNTSERKFIILSSKSTVYSATSYQCNYNKDIEKNLYFKPSIADIPVVLSKFKIEIFIEAIINLPEPVFGVKSLDKEVILEECELITGTDKLFIKGVLQENIEYATANCIKTDRISGDIKKLTIEIPFKCSTKINFSNAPQLPKVNKDKIEVKIIHLNKNYDNIIEKKYGYLQFPKNKIFCDLNSTEMLETNNKEKMKLIKNTLTNTYSFEIIRKKIILSLGLSLLQNQSTFICNSSFNNSEEIEETEKKVDTYMDNDNDIEK